MSGENDVDRLRDMTDQRNEYARRWRFSEQAFEKLQAELDLSRSCYQSALVSVGDCLAAAELLTTERNELAKECQRLMADLAAAREREQRLMTRLRCAERNTLYQDTDLDWCRICDQTAPTDQRIDHAPDCPFAAAAPSAVAQEPRGERV